MVPLVGSPGPPYSLAPTVRPAPGGPRASALAAPWQSSPTPPRVLRTSASRAVNRIRASSPASADRTRMAAVRDGREARLRAARGPVGIDAHDRVSPGQ